MARLIYANGRESKVEPENGTNFTREEVMKLLSAEMLQVMYLANSAIMIFDEEGKIRQSEVNLTATTIFQIHFNSDRDFVVGDVLICLSQEFR